MAAGGGGNMRLICLMEKMLAKTSILLHDGESKREFDGSVPTFFTRTYRIVLDGKPIKTCIRFRYDRRSGHVDFNMTWDDLATWEKEDAKCSTLESISGLDSDASSAPSESMVVPNIELSDRCPPTIK